MKSLMLIVTCLVCTVPTAAIADDKQGSGTQPVESQVVEAMRESVVTTRYELFRHPKDKVVLADHL